MLMADALEARITFGQYRGRTWAEVLDDDPGYVRWILDVNDWLDGELVDALARVLDDRA